METMSLRRTLSINRTASGVVNKAANLRSLSGFSTGSVSAKRIRAGLCESVAETALLCVLWPVGQPASQTPLCFEVIEFAK